MLPHVLTVARYIEPIPSDTAIPAWAYLPLGVGGLQMPFFNQFQLTCMGQTDGKVNLTQAKETAVQSEMLLKTPRNKTLTGYIVDEPDMTSPGSYIPPLPSRLGPSPMLGPVPTSDSTGPRSGSSTIAAPVASVAGLPEATVPESVSPSTNDLHLSATPTPITPPLVTSVNEPGSGSASIQETTSLSRTFSSFLYGPSSLSPAPTMTSDNPPSLTPQSTPQETIAKSSRNLAPIFGGVLGGIAAAVLTAFLVLRLVRRRRHRRREKEAVFASGSLDWWRRPDEHLHKAGREFTECSTMKAETVRHFHAPAPALHSDLDSVVGSTVGPRRGRPGDVARHVHHGGKLQEVSNVRRVSRSMNCNSWEILCKFNVSGTGCTCTDYLRCHGVQTVAQRARSSSRWTLGLGRRPTYVWRCNGRAQTPASLILL